MDSLSGPRELDRQDSAGRCLVRSTLPLHFLLVPQVSELSGQADDVGHEENADHDLLQRREAALVDVVLLVLEKPRPHARDPSVAGSDVLLVDVTGQVSHLRSSERVGEEAGSVRRLRSEGALRVRGRAVNSARRDWAQRPPPLFSAWDKDHTHTRPARHLSAEGEDRGELSIQSSPYLDVRDVPQEGPHYSREAHDDGRCWPPNPSSFFRQTAFET